MTNQFVKERDDAILSLDKEKIMAYLKKYDIEPPENKETFWSGVHKAILQLNSATKEQKDRSFDWLVEHGRISLIDIQGMTHMAYECSNLDSEYYKSLLNISVNGEKLKRIS